MTDKISSEDFIKAFGGGVKHNLKRPQGDLISREALKKAFENLASDDYNEPIWYQQTVFETIDNAPTMPLPNEQISWEQGYEAGLAQGKQDRPKGDILQKIPKDFVYDTETSEFYCYRNKYTGKEIHIVKNPPTYVLDKRPQGDLISREALKETIVEPLNVNDAGKNDWFEGYYTAKNEDVYYIDNAPPVPQVTVFTENADEKAVADLKAELQSVIESRPKGEIFPVELVAGKCPIKVGGDCPLSPKGEWKVRPHTDSDGDCDGYELYCSECGDVKVILLNRSFTLEEATERLKSEHKNFCFECGADMRGEEDVSST